MAAQNELDKEEMRGILTEIARNATNAAARIAAIKELRALDEGKPDDPGEGGGRDDLAELRALRPSNYQTKAS